MNQPLETELKATHLAFAGGIEVELLNCGATLKSIRVPVEGEMVEVLLHYDQNEDYLKDQLYLGATLGRYAGRIDSGRAVINGEAIQLQQNEKASGHCLHGGAAGFSQQIWALVEQTKRSVAYEYESPDGEQGFPGCLKARVDYRLRGPNTLQIGFTAVTDRETCINLSNHAYFNLNRHSHNIANHELRLNSEFFTPLGANSLPTGEIEHVGDTVFDFRKAARLAERLSEADPQLLLAGGYDHYFLLNDDMQTPGLAATLHSPESGLTMKMFTDQPGVQFYSGNWLGDPFLPKAGLCLEFQDIPNAPNMPGFPSTVLRAGEIYQRLIVLEFES